MTQATIGPNLLSMHLFLSYLGGYEKGDDVSGSSRDGAGIGHSKLRRRRFPSAPNKSDEAPQAPRSTATTMTCARACPWRDPESATSSTTPHRSSVPSRRSSLTQRPRSRRRGPAVLRLGFSRRLL